MMQKSFFIFIALFIGNIMVLAQSNATITEESIPIDTYPFHTPNPIPIVADDPKIPPYTKFEGYSHSPVKKDWKVVTLENEYIKLWVLPEIGGKVWGAIEKETGEEFLYKNEVIKFRNIAMRGPWTSGGIEFNFGIIGHHPSTATAVDYRTRTNADGSVSCIVGNTDLPSNTKWTVEIRLEKDKAYFETNASWYNASPLTASYYNWMTAAAVATNDLEFFIPGNAYLEHNGDAHAWPIDAKGRNLAMYKNNNFGPAKSYHIVGEYNDFFGGYYHATQFGFGQWSPYEEMPGQKLWVWALSRSGGIWEDLLTDSDGQYIEFQAGRLFDQYFPGAVNPISQVGFDPYGMDRWTEIWFPFKEIGGMEDASEHGVLNVEMENGETRIGINALQQLDTELVIVLNGNSTTEKISLQPMEIFNKKFSSKNSDTLEVYLKDTELHYSNISEAKSIKRPFYPDKTLIVSESQKLLQEGIEALEYREYELAHERLTQLVELDPSHRTALVKLAELEYRKTNYDIARYNSNAVLRMDTYDSGANYIAGITYRAQNDLINALESLGWAARDIKYRSVAYAQMAEVYLMLKKYERAKIYAEKSLNFNTANLNAKKVLLLISRKTGSKSFWNIKEALHLINPLDHLASFEAYFWNGLEYPKHNSKFIQNEFPSESLLGVAIEYQNLRCYKEAIQVLLKSSPTVKSKIWLAYLYRNKSIGQSRSLIQEVKSATISWVFPFRRETVPVLEWLTQQDNHWKFKYYLAQNYFVVGKRIEALQLLEECFDEPDSDIFYRFRAKMLPTAGFATLEKDYQKAFQLNADDWKLNEEFIQFYLAHEQFLEASKLSAKAYKKFPNNYNIALAHAKSLLNIGKYKKVLNLLETIKVLPFEHANESREIYERAHVAVALEKLQKNENSKALEILKQSKEWPENIGVGKPYHPDERSQNYLMAVALKKMNQTAASTDLLKTIVYDTESTLETNSANHLFGLLAAKQLKYSGLDKMLSTLEQSTDHKTRIAVALFKENTDSATNLPKEKSLATDVMELLKWAAKN